MSIVNMLPQMGGAVPSVINMTLLNTGTSGQRTLTGSATTTVDGYALVVGVAFQAQGTNQTVSCTHNGTGQTALRETYIDGERVKVFFFEVNAGDTVGVTCTTPNTSATVYASTYHIYETKHERVTDLKFTPCLNNQAGGTHSNGVSNPSSSITVPVTSPYGIVVCTSAIAYDGSSISASDPTLTCSRTYTKLTSHGVSKQEPGSAGSLGVKVCAFLVTNPVAGDVYSATFAGSHSSSHWNTLAGISYIPVIEQ